MLDQNTEIVEKYKSLVNVIQQNMDTLKYSVDTEIIMDYLEPFDASNSPSKNLLSHDTTPVKIPSKFSSTLNKKTIRDTKKRLSGDFGTTLSKKTGNNLSAKDLRLKINSPKENRSSATDIQLAHSLAKKGVKAVAGKDKKTLKKQ